uniref:Uncharacterized protein n=1 Tax=Romanomermis culicivorax TaxID=13658 RepID=A0A915KUX9_ROMCU
MNLKTRKCDARHEYNTEQNMKKALDTGSSYSFEPTLVKANTILFPDTDCRTNGEKANAARGRSPFNNLSIRILQHEQQSSQSKSDGNKTDFLTICLNWGSAGAPATSPASIKSGPFSPASGQNRGSRVQLRSEPDQKVPPDTTSGRKTKILSLNKLSSPGLSYVLSIAIGSTKRLIGNDKYDETKTYYG